MSAVGFLLQFIFALFGFLLSLKGLFAFGIGMVLFLLLPFLPQILGVFRSFANFHLWLAMWCVSRAATVVSEHNDLLFKSMTFDDLGVEQISFDSDTKDFEDPATALHHWMGFPFALADEESGILFDPRHAAIGMRKRSFVERGINGAKASQAAWKNHRIDEWLPGVFEMPTNYELVDLRAVTELIGGGERAEYPKRVEELYKLSRNPFASSTPMYRLAMPILAFLAVMVMMWQIGKNSGGGGGTTVGFGSVLFLFIGGLTGVDLKDLAKRLIVILPLPIVFLLLFVFVNPIMAVLAFIVIGMGFWFVPFLALFGRMSSFIGGGLATNVFLKLGLEGYTDPVFVWKPEGYELQEYADLGDDVTVHKWYSLVGKRIGFTYEPVEDSFSEDVISPDKVKSATETAMADGGNENIPPGYQKSSLQRSIYGLFVPDKIDPDSIYLRTDIALSRMRNAAIGEKSLRRLLQSKEKYGGGDWMQVSDKTLLLSTVGCVVLAAALGTWLFFL